MPRPDPTADGAVRAGGEPHRRHPAGRAGTTALQLHALAGQPLPARDGLLALERAFTNTEADRAAGWPLSAADTKLNAPARSYVVPARAAPLATVVSCRTSTQALLPDHRACSVTARPASGVPDVVRSSEVIDPDRSVGGLKAVPSAVASQHVRTHATQRSRRT